MSRPGRLDSSSGCRSLGRYGNRGSDSRYASRHTFTMPAAGWVTIDLESTGAGGDRVDAYVVLINGSDPGGGTVLERDDDSGRGFDSRIVRRFLQSGRYTIEATTFGRGDAGTYRLTVAADYRPLVTGPATPLRVENGDTVTLRWSYEPRSARVSIAHVDPPDGLDVRIVADDGTVTLIAAASRTATYTVHVAFSNGGTTRTGTASVTSYCPTGTVELPSDCATPLEEKQHEHDVSLWPQPSGHEETDTCTRRDGSDGLQVYTCRRIHESRQYISKTDPRILAISGDSVRFGTTLKMKPGSDSAPEQYEGCQSVTEDYWQCDYRADLLWYRTVVDGDASRYVWSAFVDGVVIPSVCSVGLIALQYGTAAAGSGLAAVVSAVTPEAIAGVIEDCRGLLRPAPPSTLEDD